MAYDIDYVRKRLRGIDFTEYIDIVYGLKCIGARKGDTILELGSGYGLLVRYPIMNMMYSNVISIGRFPRLSLII